jgi:hypothetical protein
VALVTIQGGRTFEALSTREMYEILDERERQRARGVKWMEYAVPFSSFALQPATAPANTITIGPEEGYCWSVKICSATLGSAGTLTIYKASAAGQTSRLVAFNSASQTAQVAYWAANQCFLNHGQALYLVASTSLTNYYIGAEQAIAEQEWKIFD